MELQIIPELLYHLFWNCSFHNPLPLTSTPLFLWLILFSLQDFLGLHSSKWSSLNPAVSSGESPLQLLTTSTHHGAVIREWGRDYHCPFLFLSSHWPKTWKHYAGYNPKLLGTQKPGKSPFLHRERQPINQRQSKENTGVAIQIHQSSCYTERIWNFTFILYKRVHATWNKFPFSGQMPVLPQVWMFYCLLCPLLIFNFSLLRLFTFVSLSGTSLNSIAKCLEFV